MRSLEERIMQDARSGHPCIRCGKPGKDIDGHQVVYGRHYNGQRQHQYGKGRGIKCHPVCVADFCNVCNSFFQEGLVDKDDFEGKDRYSEEFQHWCLMSLIRRAENGVIG